MRFFERRSERRRWLIKGFLSDYPYSSGARISEATGLGSGNLYVELARMERAGDVISMWSEAAGSVPSQPRRRLYALYMERTN